MAYRDLRDFMALLEKKGLLVRIKAEVDPEWEINGVTRKLQEMAGPAVLFENVGGHKVPVVCGMIGTPRHLGLALGMDTQDEKEITEEWIRRVEHPVPPKLVESGPCKENILTGDDAKISAIFPPVRWHKEDSAPYIGTLALQVTKDPETGEQNVGIYRQMVLSETETTLYMAGLQHGAIHLQKWQRMHPGKPMPMAIVIGTEPCYLLAAGAKFRHPPGEEAYAGALRQEPLELVECETCDLKVPATAEIILEGEVNPEERRLCGPFGEFTGFTTGAQEFNVFRLKAITHRNKAIFQGTREGAPRARGYVESGLLTFKGREYALTKRLKELYGVVDAYVPLWASGRHVIVSIKQVVPGLPKQIMQKIWSDPEFGWLIKHVIVVDEDVDVRSAQDIQWAIANLVQGDRDIMIIPRFPIDDLDPSQPHSKRGWTAKVGIDATMPLDEYKAEGTEPPPLCHDPDIKARVEAQWEKYGITI